MKKIRSRVILLLALIMIVSFTRPAMAVSDSELDKAVRETAALIYDKVSHPQVGSVGGEWSILGLARSGYEVPHQYYQRYYKEVENYVKLLDGNLHDKKHTEYSRLIMALTSIGKDPGDVGGYNLLTPLGDYDSTIWQGINGPIWALIALDSGNYPMPENDSAKTQASREMYIDYILESQLADGGWSLLGKSGNHKSDPDITGMALQALSKYQDKEDVGKAIEEALNCISKQQDNFGGFESWDMANSESCVQLVIALSELGISLEDSRFVKNGNTLLDNLMSFYTEGKGFVHSKADSSYNQMASEQGFCALVAVKRFKDGKSSLYTMDDLLKIEDDLEETNFKKGLENKNPNVKFMPMAIEGRTFDDINFHKNQVAIEALASRKIIDGKKENIFDPDATMTRAEFSTIIVKGLGLEPRPIDRFEDVSKDSWYYGYIGAAFEYGIVQGISDTVFNPQGSITREEAATMIARAARLCGLHTEFDNRAIRDILAQFNDYVTTSEWARSSLAFCYSTNILDQSDLEILPNISVLRWEVAQILFNMLDLANLL